MQILIDRLTDIDIQITEVRDERTTTVKRLSERAAEISGGLQRGQEEFRNAVVNGGDYALAWATIQASQEALAVVEFAKSTADGPLEAHLLELRERRSKLANAVARLEDCRREIQRHGPSEDRVGTLLTESRDKGFALLGPSSHDLLHDAERWLAEAYRHGDPGVWRQCEQAVDVWYRRQFDRLPRAAA